MHPARINNTIKEQHDDREINVCRLQAFYTWRVFMLQYVLKTAHYRAGNPSAMLHEVSLQTHVGQMVTSEGLAMA